MIYLIIVFLPHLLPEKSEIDMADIKMNAFPQATDATYIYAEAADGSQVKIKMIDLYSIFPSLSISNGGHLGNDIDFNEIVKFGLYFLNTKNNAPLPNEKRDWTVFVITNSFGDVMQIAIEYAGQVSGLYIRQKRSLVGNSWNAWSSIFFT